jgi:hypothetical protein
MSDRLEPYTTEEIRKLKCHRCGKRARFQWNACADGNIWRPVCTACDVELNKLALRFLDPKNWIEKLQRYCYRIRFKWTPTQEERNDESK